MKIKRLLSITIFSLFFILLSAFNMNVLAASGETYWDDAKSYNFTSNIKKQEELYEGTTFIHDNGTSDRSGQTIQQNIYMLFQKSNASEGTKTVTWGIYDENHSVSEGFTRATLATIAEDYEKNHPGWKVIGGINGDQFFWEYGTKLHVDGSDLFMGQPYYAMKADGEYWFAIDAMGRVGCNTTGFKNDGSTNPLVYDTNHSLGFKLSVYDENNNLIKKFDIDDLNPKTKKSGTYTYVYGLTDTGNTPPAGQDASSWSVSKDKASKSVNISSENDLYIIGESDKCFVSNSVDYSWYKNSYAVNAFFGKGAINSIAKSTTLTSTQFAIETTDSELLALLGEGTYVMAQYELGGEYDACESSIGWHTAQRIDGVDRNVANSYNSRGYPRSCFGVTSDGTIVLINCNGTKNSGTFAQEINALCKAYDIVSCFQMDGGGSASMIVRGDNGKFETVNNPSDGSDRLVFNGVFFVVRDVEAEIETTEVTESSLSFNVNVTDYGTTANVTKTYLNLTGKTINGQVYDETKEIVDGKVTFDDLAPNSEYTYNVQYKVENQENLKKAFTKNNVMTGKRLPEITKVKIVYDDDSKLKINVSISDPDKSIAGFVKLSFDGGETFYNLSNGSYTFDEFTGDPIGNVRIRYMYDIKDGEGTITKIEEDLNLEYTLKIFMDSMIYSHNDSISKVFK